METPETIPQQIDTLNFLPEASREEERMQFFLFEIDGELYAVPALDVDHVMKIPPVTIVPNAPLAIAGIFHMRGKVVVVLDILKRMHLSRTRPLIPSYLFVTHMQKNYFAILVDHPKTVVHIPQKDVVAPDPVIAAHIPPRYIKGMFMYTLPLPQQSNLPDFMIKPEAAASSILPETSQLRPVLWLNVEEILNQEDLLHVGEDATPH